MRRFALFAVLVISPLALGASYPEAPPVVWGEHGHRMIGEAAARKLPAEMPAFFRDAADQLSYLNPEPDRWRAREERSLDGGMDGAHAPEHYIDMELLPAGALKAPDRLAYADSLRAAGVDASKAGLLPYRILELTQRIRVSFRQWRSTKDPKQRAWIEQRILNDAGILGHYVADASNPAHTSIHHNGWVGENPRGYATDSRFHSRFESEYVQRHMKLADVTAAMASAPRVFPDARKSVMDYLLTSHGELERLYQIDQRQPFGAKTTAAENKKFTAERLAAGAEMLRDLWWTAWVTSGEGAPGGRGR
jgi:hypothetical protein